MKNLPDNSPFICPLPERCLVKVSGADAAAFLQSLITHDVMALTSGQLAYSCLLTPQGRFLHDFFIFREEAGFFLECETQRREDLIRRLTVFRLRAKVTIEDCRGLFSVYAGSAPAGNRSFSDPRLKELGYRFYLPANEAISGMNPEIYKDRRITLCVPEGSSEIKPEIDTLSDVNLDRLQAVSWDKGCYVGQEVTARMKNRALVKKRMMIVSGQHLAAGSALTQGGYAVGDVRAVNAAATEGLAILKLAVLEETTRVLQPDGSAVSAQLPAWVNT
jgi:folate-binding protein YgfZ